MEETHKKSSSLWGASDAGTNRKKGKLFSWFFFCAKERVQAGSCSGLRIAEAAALLCSGICLRALRV